MKPPNQHQRINLSELKARLFKRLGPEKSAQYFDCLNKFLNLKMSKVEFDKLCQKLLGKENLSLHSQLIRAVLQNACSVKIPPPMPLRIKKDSIFTDNGSLPLGKNLTASLGVNGGLGSLSHNSWTKISNGVLENGSLKPCDSQKPLQHHQELIGDRFDLGYNRAKSRALVVEEENNLHKFSRSQLKAPIRTVFHPVAGRRRCSRLYDSDGLLDTNSLREQMQHIAADQGLEGVMQDCANLLNLGLDLYLKRLIGSCVLLARTRTSTSVLSNKSLQRDHLQHKLGSDAFLQSDKSRYPITMLDIKAAIELRQQELGADLPLLLEKVGVHLMKE